MSQGVELYGQYTFDFGFGVQANYTYNDTNLVSIVLDGQESASPLVGSAKNQANVTVFYENEKFSRALRSTVAAKCGRRAQQWPHRTPNRMTSWI